MDSRPSIPGPPQDQKAAEEALTELLREATAIASDRRTDMARSDALRAAEPSIDAMLGPVADLKDDRFPATSSPGKRASRVLSRFLIVAFIGVGCTLAWQSYGEAAKKKLASWAPPIGWVRLGPGLKPSPGAGSVAEQPSPAAVQESVPDSSQAASAAQAAPDIATPTAPAAPSPEVQQQLEVMARDLAALRQSVDQLTIGQEQMARDIASLQAAEKDTRHRTSALPPKPTPAPKPPPRPPSQATPTAPPPPALPRPMPPPMQTAPETSSAPASPALPPVQPAPEISASPPGPPPPSRPPMPVPN
jgi:chemotaxis protein histidine kinase CheA